MKAKSLTRNIQQERKGGSKSFLDILSEGVFREWSSAARDIKYLMGGLLTETSSLIFVCCRSLARSLAEV